MSDEDDKAADAAIAAKMGMSIQHLELAREAMGPERVWPVTVTLTHPIQYTSKIEVTELVFQKGQLGFLKVVRSPDNPSIGDLLELASKLCGQTTTLLEKLNPDDADEVLSIAMGFIGRCRGVGRRLSR